MLEQPVRITRQIPNCGVATLSVLVVQKSKINFWATCMLVFTAWLTQTLCLQASMDEVSSSVVIGLVTVEELVQVSGVLCQMRISWICDWCFQGFGHSKSIVTCSD